MPAGRSGRRQVPPQDVARYWQSRASGMSIKEAAKIAAFITTQHKNGMLNAV